MSNDLSGLEQQPESQQERHQQEQHQRQIDALYRWNMYFGIAALVLLIVLLVAFIAPYVHLGRLDETDKVLQEIASLKASVQALSEGGPMAQQLDKKLKPLECEVRALRRACKNPNSSAKTTAEDCPCD